MSTFSFILIPCDDSLPVELKEGPVDGGLENDYLVNYAKKYFHDQKNSGSQQQNWVEMIDKASPEERKLFAQEIRKNNPGSEKFDDDFLINMFRNSQSTPSCEIQAVQFPTKTNGFIGISIYCANDGKERNLRPNKRAIDILRDCGHTSFSMNQTENSQTLLGDAFIGRYHDDEAQNIWKRVDFTIDEIVSDRKWCEQARRKGGGGGQGNSSPSSLSGIMNQTLNRNNTYQQRQSLQNQLLSASDTAENTNGETIAEFEGNPYVWSQSQEDVELKFNVAGGTKAKYCKVVFTKSSLKVTVAGQTLFQGSLNSEISVDDSTYTLQQLSSQEKELTVTLNKKIPSEHWGTVKKED